MKPCGHVYEGGQNVIAPRACGKPVKYRAHVADEWLDVCGRHANFWATRNKVVIPIVFASNRSPLPPTAPTHAPAPRPVVRLAHSQQARSLDMASGLREPVEGVRRSAVQCHRSPRDFRRRRENRQAQVREI